MKNYTNQSGRSMIEMLGVLAVIGVLSVGGISGYSKAMMKYRVNKTIEQITLVSQNIRTFFLNQKDYSGLPYFTTANYINFLKKANLVPKEMINDECTKGEDCLKNPFDGNFTIVYSHKTAGDQKAISIYLYSLPQEACIEIATYDWGSNSSAGLIGIGVNAHLTYQYLGECSGYVGDGTAVSCAGALSNSIPMRIDSATRACHDGNSNFIQFKFY